MLVRAWKGAQAGLDLALLWIALPHHIVRKAWALLGRQTILCVRFGRLWVARPYCAYGLGACGLPNHAVRRVWAVVGRPAILCVRSPAKLDPMELH